MDLLAYAAISLSVALLLLATLAGWYAFYRFVKGEVERASSMERMQAEHEKMKARVAQEMGRIERVRASHE